VKTNVSELQNNVSFKDTFSERNQLQYFIGLPILIFPAIKIKKKRFWWHICEEAF
jgi:hypothetical protein